MSRIIFFVIMLAGIVFWWHWKNTTDAKLRKRLLQRSVIGALIIFLLMMVVTGHMNWMGAVLAGVLAFVRQNIGLVARYAPVITQFYRAHVSASQPSGTATVSTRFIRMNLDHATGKLSGNVLAGEFQGRALDSMNKSELDRLQDWCGKNDADSARLLESYISARFGANSGSSTHNNSTGVSAGDMTVEEALQVLGLKAEPSKEEITQAYRKIIQQLHPDRGGNEYFAAKANQARQVLNKRFG
jgi:DnaJ-domain-containing protein 1